MATATINATDSNAITITLASLTNSSTNTSSAIDNSTSKYVAARVQVKLKTGASGVSATGYSNVWLLSSADGGTTYDDAGRTLLGVLSTVANATTYVASFTTEPFGLLPRFWKIAVENQSGATFDTTAGNFSATYSGYKLDIA